MFSYIPPPIPPPYEERMKWKKLREEMFGTKKKYMCIGGYVRSKYDRQLHYIGPLKLAELYHVDIKECVLLSDIYDPKRFGCRDEDYIILEPDYSGAYKLDEKG